MFCMISLCTAERSFNWLHTDGSIFFFFLSLSIRKSYTKTHALTPFCMWILVANTLMHGSWKNNVSNQRKNEWASYAHFPDLLENIIELFTYWKSLRQHARGAWNLTLQTMIKRTRIVARCLLCSVFEGKNKITFSVQQTPSFFIDFCQSKVFCLPTEMCRSISRILHELNAVITTQVYK